jgi:peptidoglycan/xylan/chitin deacetylase (PgdA/CDA1 family)
VTSTAAEIAAARQAGEIDPADYLYERYRGPLRRSLVLKAYYALKPLLPRRLWMALRRMRARGVLDGGFPAWPVEPLLIEHQHRLWRRELSDRSAASLPIVNFWPSGHRFAVTITHDVEGTNGVENIEAVLAVERAHGIVSSWNFVAEWYPIPPSAFAAVREAGGEIGLHGIKHDGLLFRDRASFSANLPAIHRYMREWGAVGFRSPATHRNAEWMPELACLYDSSFPDTDPYEPQPGGCCSILPYFIGDLVELPITMVQDHTMWELLREPTIRLWREKAAWVIANHGLINVIIHPDYVLSRQRLELYAELLAFLREQIDERDGWHALPRDVAGWWQARDLMSVSERDGAAEIAPGAAAAQWSARATVASVSLRDGAVAIDG